MAVVAAVVLAPLAAQSQTNEAIREQVAREKAPLLDTLRDLVGIESGSRDIEGVNRIADLIANRLRALGGSVELLAPGNDAHFDDTPPQIGRMVLARFQGTGTKKIMLIAHMDTVYEKGMSAQQPFRIDGNRAYGLGTPAQVLDVYGLTEYVAHKHDLDDLSIETIEQR
jgi:glutamate carboxypeptidase